MWQIYPEDFGKIISNKFGEHQQIEWKQIYFIHMYTTLEATQWAESPF